MLVQGSGRFAPSPTADLHLGNLRTAVLAWLFARSTGRAFVLRIEDLDTARVAAAQGVAARQVGDLASLGLNFDGEVVWQSRRLEVYAQAISNLDTYPCYCTRKEIAEAASAPNGDGLRPYPGTCLQLSAARKAELAATRSPAIRVRAANAVSTVHDTFAGQVSGVVDDFVLFRNDGAPAYNLAVVVDDLAAGVDQVVRGSDLLSSAPRQAWLATKLAGQVPQYVHVPLAINSQGVRLAKRDGAVTLADLQAINVGPAQALSRIAESLNLAEAGEQVTVADLLSRFDPDQLPRKPWVVTT